MGGDRVDSTPLRYSSYSQIASTRYKSPNYNTNSDPLSSPMPTCRNDSKAHNKSNDPSQTEPYTKRAVPKPEHAMSQFINQQNSGYHYGRETLISQVRTFSSLPSLDTSFRSPRSDSDIW